MPNFDFGHLSAGTPTAGKWELRSMGVFGGGYKGT